MTDKPPSPLLLCCLTLTPTICCSISCICLSHCSEGSWVIRETESFSELRGCCGRPGGATSTISAILWGLLRYFFELQLQSGVGFICPASIQNLHKWILDPDSPNLIPTMQLSSIEAEMIIFLQKKAAILGFCLLRPSYKYFNVAPRPV